MRFVREGQKVWPYCEDCGCRLDFEKVKDRYEIFHFFSGIKFTDARGHYCKNATYEWHVPDQYLEGVLA